MTALLELLPPESFLALVVAGGMAFASVGVFRHIHTNKTLDLHRETAFREECSKTQMQISLQKIYYNQGVSTVENTGQDETTCAKCYSRTPCSAREPSDCACDYNVSGCVVQQRV